MCTLPIAVMKREGGGHSGSTPRPQQVLNIGRDSGTAGVAQKSKSHMLDPGILKKTAAFPQYLRQTTQEGRWLGV